MRKCVIEYFLFSQFFDILAVLFCFDFVIDIWTFDNTVNIFDHDKKKLSSRIQQNFADTNTFNLSIHVCFKVSSAQL